MIEKPEMLEIEDAKLLGGQFKNFSGKQTDFSREGDRYINIRIPADEAEDLSSKGWNIKCKAPKEEGDEPLYYLKVNIKFKADGGKKDPAIYKGVDPEHMRRVTVKNVSNLDREEFVKIDVVINPSYWSRSSGAEGISAYLDSMYCLIKGNRFTSKYTVVEDSYDDDVEDED